MGRAAATVQAVILPPLGRCAARCGRWLLSGPTMIDHRELARIRDALDRVVYKAWVPLITKDGTIYWQWLAPCNVNGGPAVWQRGRDWYVAGMSEDAIIKTAYAAIKMAEEHELMENFRVDGVMVFNPHTPIDTLKRAQ